MLVADTAKAIIHELELAFAEVPRPGIPENYAPSGRLGNPGWDEFTYHSALVFAEQLPEHARRVFASPGEYLHDFLWHLSDSERLGVFTKSQIALLLTTLDFLEANYAPAIRKQRKESARLKAVRAQLERLLSA
jgi:hypothetical protein